MFRTSILPFSCAMSKGISISTAAAYGLAHWALLAVAQAENIGRAHLAWLPLMQAQNAVVAVLIAALAWAAWRAAWSRWAFLAAYLALTLVVVVSPGYFQMFGDHPRLSLNEGGVASVPAQLLSSVSAAAAAAWWKLALNTGLAVVALVWLRRERRAIPRRLAAAPALAVMLGFFPISAAVQNASHHPLYPLIQESLLSRVGVGLSTKSGDDSPVDAQPSTSPELAAAVAKIRAASPRPNVVFIVLESVGAQQLLGDLANTPNIAALARSAIVFDHVYAVYPSTARNHLAINTGGFHITGNDMIEMLHHDFTGPLMARGFGEAGYATALFSSERLDVEAMDEMERRAGWGTLYDFGRDVKNHLSANILNSWCAKEEFTLTQLEPWLEAHRAAPFLLSYMNGATHHPYSIPRGSPEPNGRADDIARYRNSLHYTDAAIGQLIAMLKARGLYENTIIAITGDHGEAFGDHAGNFAHKNAIYEENIRTFLLLAHPALGANITSGRIASSGDNYPTLATLAGFAVQTPGLPLASRDFPARAVFFSKGAFPEQWGLRDGKWKFIQAIRERQAELYDLAADPAERTNLASVNAALVAKFSDQCERWFLRTDAASSKQFTGYTPATAPRSDGVEATPRR